MLQILSYNVNGIRAASRKGFYEWLQDTQPDIVCVQETKAWPEQLSDAERNPEGYHVYWHSAEKKGYSGTAIFSKREPNHVEIGCGIDFIDREGRVIRADYDECSVMCLYAPSGSAGDHRQSAKDDFMDAFKPYIKDLLAKHPKLIISGDYNIAHHPIDIHDPVSNKKSSGFLPYEREWFTEFQELGLIDTFRHFHPEEPDHYSWWSYRAAARQRNKGWRIDYHLASTALNDQLHSAAILSEVVHSDHCPIQLIVDC